MDNHKYFKQIFNLYSTFYFTKSMVSQQRLESITGPVVETSNI